MRFTVQYIPLNKLKPPDFSTKMTAHLRKLRGLVWDCMHLLVVRKNRRDGSYTILLGNDRYEFLRQHTKKQAAPCLIDESRPQAEVRSWLNPWRGRQRSGPVPGIRPDRMTLVAWSVMRVFLKEEPRFKQLTRSQQFEVLMLAVRYRKTILASMKSKVDRMSS